MKLKSKIMDKLIRINICIFVSLFLLSNQSVVQAQKINTSYIYFSDKSKYVQLVDDTNDSVDIVYPSYFDINEDGSLKLTKKIDIDFINEMHKKNIKVVPFLSNHWDRELGRTALNNKENLVKEIVQAVKKYNLDGVNVDIENVTDVDKDDYTEFVKLLRKSIPLDKELSVAVAANPNGWIKGWQASYDYKNLAKYSDYLFIMAYDESYMGGPKGPVASISFVEESIRYALKYVDSKKIVLGLPFYGRYWKVGEEIGGYGASLEKIDSIIKRYPSNIVFDDISKSPMATVYKPDGIYIYWYENEQSIIEKLKLVEKYNLKGSGSWSLGQEKEDFWDYYSLWLDGYYFLDIYDNWALDSILSMIENGWMKGTSDMYFSPNSELTRAQAAVILVRILGLENENITSYSFEDVSYNHWASKEIEIARKHNIINGKGNNMFYPEDSLTREEMAAMLYRIIKNEKIDYNEIDSFKDISSDDWSYEYILAMNKQGIFKGYDDGNFYPKREVNRAQMATLMDRISEYNIDIIN
ncbi:S-layer homology domain-containing protein [Tepidibacter formicigenes]|uniref:Spore germination protein YaaH n=1 Tax=Tepidibacter formicigenes DSM 15518 TaxID=1123349 RepID=A0A1M6NHW9_9FIRM|nr:S-layer homology domain-containing protein [Tepidibacter formicigenes]SHJ95233.1 Spore germination protein YaaH [Tepidibacter formicigenes DSM 15518]